MGPVGASCSYSKHMYQLHSSLPMAGSLHHHTSYQDTIQQVPSSTCPYMANLNRAQDTAFASAVTLVTAYIKAGHSLATVQQLQLEHGLFNFVASRERVRGCEMGGKSAG